MFDCPRNHSCFQHLQMYNVNFDEYKFKHRCDNCRFGSNSVVVMRKHLCSRTPFRSEFPSSQGNQTPPHAIFEGQSPHLASQQNVNNSESPPPSQSQENISHAQVDEFPLVVLLVAEVNAPQVESTSTATEIPATISEQPPFFNGTCCRLIETNTVHFVFPIRDYLRCTEAGFEAMITQTKWSGARSSLFRHLNNIYKIVPDIIRWCGTCNVIVPEKISSHSCFRSGGYFKIPKEIVESQSFKYICLICKMSFPNATSLSSHTTAHDKRERYRQLGATTLKENLRTRNQAPSNLIPDSPPTSPPNVNASSPSSLLVRHLQIHLLFYHWTVKSMLIFPIQYLLNLFLQSNNPQDQATTYEIPHPDDPPPFSPL